MTKKAGKGDRCKIFYDKICEINYVYNVPIIDGFSFICQSLVHSPGYNNLLFKHNKYLHYNTNSLLCL